MPTPTEPRPDPKLPVAVGWRSPIFKLAFNISTARSCGDCSTLVLASANTACSKALGMVVEKSAVESRPRFENGMAVGPELVGVVGLVLWGGSLGGGVVRVPRASVEGFA